MQANTLGSYLYNVSKTNDNKGSFINITQENIKELICFICSFEENQFSKRSQYCGLMGIFSSKDWLIQTFQQGIMTVIKKSKTNHLNDDF